MHELELCKTHPPNNISPSSTHHAYTEFFFEWKPFGCAPTTEEMKPGCSLWRSSKHFSFQKKIISILKIEHGTLRLKSHFYHCTIKCMLADC